jgi:hypothetical protein
MDRCNDLLDLTETIEHLRLLEGMIVGGRRGASITQLIRHIFAEFMEAYNEFQVSCGSFWSNLSPLFIFGFYDFFLLQPVRVSYNAMRYDLPLSRSLTHL